MMLLHLHFVCRVATHAEVPPIWREVAQAQTKGDALSILNQYLWAGRDVCRRQFYGAADTMHVCGALFMFVHGDRFMNPGADPAYPAGGLSFWSRRQGGGVLGYEIVETEEHIIVLDRVNVWHEEVTSAMRVKLAVVVGPQTMATDTGTLAFAYHSLFGAPCLMVEAIIPIVDWINENQPEWGRIM